MTDWGPGQNHIVLQNENKQFYRPEVFGESLTYDKIVPLFINDIKHSVNLFRIYKHVYFQLSDIIMINNWPISKVEIFGRIVGEIYQPEKGFAKLNIDDCSGKKSIFVLNIPYNCIIESNIKTLQENYGKLVIINGFFHNNKLIVENLRLESDDTQLEFKLWSERVEFRESVLKVPWIFKPGEKINEQKEIVYGFSQRELARKEERKRLSLTSDDITMTSGIEDSLVVLENKMVIDLTDEPEVIEIIDEDVHQNKIRFVNMIKECLITVIESSFEEIALADLIKSDPISSIINQFEGVDSIANRIGLYFEKSDLFTFENGVIGSSKFDQMYHNILKHLNEKSSFNVNKYVIHVQEKLSMQNIDPKLINFIINYLLVNRKVHKKWSYSNNKWIST
ncbi:uncharacterized protein KGF55_005577 [Candida pseudojiufengensis]|uniref:uncharacterized protein n=1 Tax=Candida pseudojiufengensis TaxID=497109 RepID=UPI0022246926|nr:uncharacterized protein KGF55_005577 [Candida pseudojiufengensis]KAI5959086.1 hypothetical protein KGF55_005577 [Candida pseudojiufengensis]